MISSIKNCKVLEIREIDVGSSVLTKTGLKRVKAIRSYPDVDCCDITLLHDGGKLMGESNFVLSNGVVSHNSNIPLISDCIGLIETTTGTKIARSDIPVSDREAILLGSKRDLVGIFQFENPATRPIADAVGMESLMDIAVVTSLIRPGPMDAEINGVRMPLEFARRKHGGAYESPEFIRVALAETHSLLCFQENIMLLSRVLSGFTAVEANRLRKASAKKQQGLMASIRDQFINGAKPRIDAGEISLEGVKDIWGQIETFANYSFPKPHAVAYGAITTVEMWLKHNFPVQFCTALINNTHLGKKKHGSDNILVDYVNYARRRGIPVLGPDINASGDEFRIEGDSIRFALGHIKNVASAAQLIESCQPFTDMKDFYERARVVESDDDEDDSAQAAQDGEVEEATGGELLVAPKKSRRPNRKVVESLIAAGAFDRFGTRNDMAMEYWRLIRKPSRKDRLAKKVVEAEGKAKEAALALVAAQNSGIEKEVKKANKALVKAEERVGKVKQAIIDDEASDVAIAQTQGEAKKSKDVPPEDKTVEEWQMAEAEMLGLCFSKPILYKQYEETIRKEEWYLVSDIDPLKKKVKVFGEIVEVRQHTSKAGNFMHIVTLSDGLDSMNFFVFQGGWEKFNDNYRAGYIGAVPLAKFDDDGGTPDVSKRQTRFFDDRGECVVLKKV
jgi:DNA polymerase III alpha subunit